MKKSKTHLSTSGKRVACDADQKACPRGGHLEETYAEQNRRVEAEKILIKNSSAANIRFIKSHEILSGSQQIALAETPEAYELILSGKITDPQVKETAMGSAMKTRSDLSPNAQANLMRIVAQQSDNSALLREIYEKEKHHNGITSNPDSVLTRLAGNPATPEDILTEIANNSQVKLTVEAVYANPHLNDEVYRDALAETNTRATSKEEGYAKSGRVAGVLQNPKTPLENLAKAANMHMNNGIFQTHVGKNPQMASESAVQDYLNEKYLTPEALHYRIAGVSSNAELESAAVPALLKAARVNNSTDSALKNISQYASKGSAVSQAIMEAQSDKELSVISSGFHLRSTPFREPLTTEAADKLTKFYPKAFAQSTAFPKGYIEANGQNITASSVKTIRTRNAQLSRKVWNQLALKATSTEDRISIATNGRLDDISTTSYALDEEPKVRMAITKNASVSDEVLQLIVEREKDEKIHKSATLELKRRTAFDKRAK